MKTTICSVGALALLSASALTQADAVLNGISFVEKTNPFPGREYNINFDDPAKTTYNPGENIVGTFTIDGTGYKVVFTSTQATQLGGTGQAIIEAQSGYLSDLNVAPYPPPEYGGFGDFIFNLDKAENSGQKDFYVEVTLDNGDQATYNYGGGNGENWLGMQAPSGSLITNIAITGDPGGWNQFKQPRVSEGVVPIPAAAWLFGSALLGMAGIGYRRKDADV